MKRKLMKICLLGSLLPIGLFPATALAQSNEDAVCTCMNLCTEGNVNEECPVCREDITKCLGVRDETGSEEAEGPLTPAGNMNLVDDYGDHAESGKQFLTVTTRDGKYFYLIIDRDDNGAETVHFLNQVDASDLLALLDEDQQKELKEELGIDETDTKTTSTTPSFGTEDKTDASAGTSTDETAAKTETKTTEKTTKKKKNISGLLGLLLIGVLAGVGGYFYFKTTKGQKKKVDEPDPDADYTEDDEDYLKFPEEEADAENPSSTESSAGDESNDEGGKA